MISVCSNCGEQGHFFRECREPITSLGILAFRRKEKTEWLLICRKDSLGFIEIMRGKYDIHNHAGIQSLIEQTTLSERARMLEHNFLDLWETLWNGQASKRYMVEFELARNKFEHIRPILPELYAQSTTSWTEPEWGFPKGRRSTSESEINCAFRETMEETGVGRKHLKLLMCDPLVEEFRGSNGILYRHRYWLAEAQVTLNVCMDPANIDQRKEIGAVRWFTTNDALSVIRPYNLEKKATLEKAASIVDSQHILSSSQQS